MQKVTSFLCKMMPCVQICFIVVWLSNLAMTDAFISVYALIAFGAFYLLTSKRESTGFPFRWKNAWIDVLAFLFSAGVLLANYPLFTTIGDPAVIGRSTSILMNCINTVFTLTGGFFVFRTIFVWFYSSFPKKLSTFPTEINKLLPIAVFFSIALINMVHLFLVEFPGNVTEDPFTQISEIVAGSYSNFNTFWHTSLLRIVLFTGYNLFSDVNYAIGFFCAIQSLLMAFAFTYCLITMLYYGVPKIVVAISYMIFAFVPYNIALSITIWKDVLYAGGCLLMISSWLRIYKNLGRHLIFDYIVFVFGSLLFLLSRTNGWIVYLVFALCNLLFVRNNKKLLATMAFFSVIGWFLLNPALSMLNVQDSDPVESFSVPIQQVSRVIAQGKELTVEEEQLLSRVIDLEDVPDLYTEWLSDPMKVEFRSKDYDFLCSHLGDFGRLWLNLGLRYPTVYVVAWVEQTKGYWNAGYDVALYSETVTENPYGVVKSSSGNVISALFGLYFGLSRHIIFFEPLHSIGLHVWIMLLCFLLNIVRKREEWVLALPSLLIVIGLCFGTPVYYCFRYVYPLFVSIPLIVSTALFQPES